MYQANTSRPVFVREDDGTNSPLIHQRMISKLTVGLGVLFYHQQAIPLEPLPETPLGEGSGHPVPDLLLYDNQAEMCRIIIEVSHPRTAAHDVKKIIRLIEDEDYGILEGFVFNYGTGQWLRYKSGDGHVATESAFSDLLGLSLAEII